MICLEKSFIDDFFFHHFTYEVQANLAKLVYIEKFKISYKVDLDEQNGEYDLKYIWGKICIKTTIQRFLYFRLFHLLFG